MGFDVAVLVDDHRPEDLLLILRLVLLTTPMIHGAHLKRDRFLDDVHPDGIGTIPVAVPPPILRHAPGLKATIVVGAGAQAKIIQA